MNKKQIIAIIAMIVAGVLFGAFVLLKDSNKTPGDRKSVV